VFEKSKFIHIQAVSKPPLHKRNLPAWVWKHLLRLYRIIIIIYLVYLRLIMIKLLILL